MSRLAALAAALLATWGASAEARRSNGPRALDDEVAAFYARREFAPAWADRAPALELLAALEAAGDDGLDPADYGAAALKAGLSGQWTAESELSLTRAFLLFAHHLREGRVPPSAVGASYATPALDAGALLDDALALGVRQALLRARPAWPGYAELREQLARLRAAQAEGGWPRIPHGPGLDPGAEGERVAILRARLLASGDLAEHPGAGDARGRYDAPLEAAVRGFQERHGLAVDGRAGRATLAALDVPLERRIEQVVLNLERLRWLPDPPRSRHVVVNVAAFELVAREGGTAWLESPVVVGEPDWPTPLLQDAVEAVEVHPAWRVPPKIVREDLVKLLARSPRYAEKVGLRAFLRASGEEVDPAQVRWNRRAAGRYTLVQDPGPENPLGEVKIALRNPLAVHLHATPSPAAFARIRRGESHGCIRVRWAHDLARFVLEDAFDVSAFEAALAGDATARIVPGRAVPVYLIHASAWVDEAGRLQLRPDLYDVDARLKEALGRRAAAAPARSALAPLAPGPG